MGLEDCFRVVWPKAVVHLDNSADGIRQVEQAAGAFYAAGHAQLLDWLLLALPVACLHWLAGLLLCTGPTSALSFEYLSKSGLKICRYLDRPYAQVDRPKLKRKLLQRCADQGGLTMTDGHRYYVPFV